MNNELPKIKTDEKTCKNCIFNGTNIKISNLPQYYEIKEIVSVIASIRDANHGCLKIGLDAIIECNINGYPMIDYAANINKPVKVLSAYISKAKSYLKTNQEFLDAITHR